MKYITIKEASIKWNVSERSVQGYCKNNKIPGIKYIGKQWLIPIDSEKPIDGRAKNVRNNMNYDTYRFPIFVYSEYFTERNELNEEELTLLDAQILTIKGKFSESFEICLKLISNTYSSSIRFGAYCTNAYNSILMGANTELNICLSKMEQIRDNNPLHYEDYKLLIEYIRFQISFNSKEIEKIDINKLSADALNAYELIDLCITLFDKSAKNIPKLNHYEILCKRLENSGITPGVLVAHGYSAHLFAFVGDNEGCIYHIKKACAIGYKEKFYPMLSKSSALNYTLFTEAYQEYGEDFVQTMHKSRTTNMKNWKAIFTLNNNFKLPNNLDTYEYELLLLLSNGIPNKAIAKIQKVSESKLKTSIANISEQLGLKTKAELIKYANTLFASGNGE